MTRAEWIEAVLIVAVANATAWLRPYLPAQLTGAQAILGFAVLLLAQSLVRDVGVLLRQRGADRPARTASCMCLESTVGAIGVVAGLVVAGFGDFAAVPFGRAALALGVAATLALGLTLKDWVITWRPWGLRREKDHLNLLVRWKR